MYSQIYRLFRLFYPGGLIKRQRFNELEKTQWLSKDELEALQLERIKKVVKYAYDHVLFYHDKYRSLDIHPEDIQSYEDFQELPFLTRDDVIFNLESLVSPELRSSAVQGSTGGSTGQPMHFFAEKAFSYWDNALELQGRGWYGVREGDKVAYVWGARRDFHDRNRKDRLKAKLLRERYLNAFNMTEENMQSFAEMLVKWRPAMIRAYVSSIFQLAQYVREQGVVGIQPKLIETTAEKMKADQREVVEDVFQCPVDDWYSGREFGTIAFQCKQGGLHVCETRYLEIIANGKVVEPGVLGEVVITSTHQYAMPFIRYKNEDMAVYDPYPCPCGRNLPVLREIVGRLNDFLVATDGRFVHPELISHIFKDWPIVFRYQVYQPDKDHLDVRLVCKRSVSLNWLDQIQRELQLHFGKDMHIKVREVGHFEVLPQIS